MIKIISEGSKYKIILDLRGENFGIKNNHLCAFDFAILKNINNNYLIKNLKKLEMEIDSKIKKDYTIEDKYNDFIKKI